MFRTLYSLVNRKRVLVLCFWLPLSLTVLTTVSVIGVSSLKESQNNTRLANAMALLNGGVSAGGSQNGIAFHLRGLPPLVTDRSLAELATTISACHVKRINFGVTPITDKGLIALVNCDCSSIEEFDLSGTQITDAGVVSLSKCPNIQRLSINSRVLSEESVNAIHGMTKLQELWIYSADMSNQHIKQVQAISPQIEIKVFSRPNFLDL